MEFVFYILAASIATILTRFLPYWLFKKKTQNHHLVYLQKTSGLVIMAILTIYAMKTINFSDFKFGFIAIFCLILVFALQIWRKNFLLSIVLPTLIYMALIRIIS